MKIPEYVSAYDPQNQFEVLIESYKQIEFAWNNKFDLSKVKRKTVDAVIISGLGGSAIAGDLLKNYLKDELKIPIYVNRNYHLPSFATKNSLLIASSYSGNTEETLSVLKEGIRKKCGIVCISTGGELLQIARKNGIPFAVLQSGFQPRFALGLSFFTLLKIFQKLGFISSQKKFVDEIIQLWKTKGREYSSEDNKAYRVAESLLGFVPLIYSAADQTDAAGNRMKCQLNENSKMHAFHNSIPELNHNEIIGWETANPAALNAKVIMLIDKDYHPQVKKRFEITEGLIGRSKAEVIKLQSHKKEFKVRLMDLIYLCDWITYYAAVLRGYDPSEIDYIHNLKENLAE